jgi:hypothetical protein
MEGQEVDWKRLVQFALLGSGDLEQSAGLVRVSIGLFFRHLRSKQIVCRRQQATYVRNAA